MKTLVSLTGPFVGMSLLGPVQWERGTLAAKCEHIVSLDLEGRALSLKMARVSLSVALEAFLTTSS